jgi:molecular chaperone HscB
VICWSCERATVDGETCASCGAILPPEPSADHFSVLGVPMTYGVDLAAAEARFRELSRRFHPDRFATADPRARRASLQRSVQLNEAWRTIKDPLRRAEYLLRLAGYDVGAEHGASRPGMTDPKTGAGTDREKIAVPPRLLGEILELREELADARAAGDDERVAALSRSVRAQLDAAEAGVAAALGGVPAGQTAPREALEIAAHELIAIRYYRRFLDEVAVHEEAVAARGDRVSHA